MQKCAIILIFATGGQTVLEKNFLKEWLKVFKNISVKKARITTAIICGLIGIVYAICSCFNHDTSFEKFIGIFIGISMPALFYMAMDLSLFAKRAALENNISYAKSILSKEEYRKINLKLGYNEFVNLSVEESSISYYAKIKSDREVEISIHKEEKEISNKIIDVFAFRRFFTA